MRSLWLALCMFLPAIGLAQTAGIITLTPKTTTADGQTEPEFTWSTQPAASSCTASGDWSGVKAASGTEKLPTVKISGAYNLTCLWGDDKVTFSWEAVTMNTNGTPYQNHKLYRVNYGTNLDALDQTFDVIGSPGEHVTSHVFQPLSAGRWYFVARAINQNDAQSGPSTPPVSKLVTGATASVSIDITIRPVPNAPANPQAK